MEESTGFALYYSFARLVSAGPGEQIYNARGGKSDRFMSKNELENHPRFEWKRWAVMSRKAPVFVYDSLIGIYGLLIR